MIPEKRWDELVKICVDKDEKIKNRDKEIERLRNKIKRLEELDNLRFSNGRRKKL